MYRNEREPNRYDNNLPPGHYLLGSTFMIFKRSKKGVVYASVKYEVVAGLGKGAEFWSPLFLYSNGQRPSKLEMQLKACDYHDYVNPDDHAAVADAVLWKPFKAEVSRDFYRNKPQNSIKRFMFDSHGDVNKKEHEMMDKWYDRHQNKQARFKDNTVEYRRESNYSAPPMPTDDDCPF